MSDLTNMSVNDLIDKIHQLSSALRRECDHRYPEFDLSYDTGLREGADLWVEIFIRDDSELTYAYKEAKDIFGGLADEIFINFDDQEDECCKHWVSIVFKDELNLTEVDK